MATRFRLPSAGAAPVSVTPQSYTHDSGVQRPLLLSNSSALSTVAYTPDGSDHLADGDALHSVFVSNALSGGIAFTTSGNGEIAVQALESHANNNLFLQLTVKVVSEDGATLRATLVDKATSAPELPTALAAQIRNFNIGANYTTVAGDRLVVEISAQGTPTAAGGVQGHNFSLRLGADGGGGDITSAGQTGTTLNPWIEFSNDITEFVAPCVVEDYDQVVERQTTVAKAGAAAALALAVGIAGSFNFSDDIVPQPAPPEVIVDSGGMIGERALHRPVFQNWEFTEELPQAEAPPATASFGASIEAANAQRAVHHSVFKHWEFTEELPQQAGPPAESFLVSFDAANAQRVVDRTSFHYWGFTEELPQEAAPPATASFGASIEASNAQRAVRKPASQYWQASDDLPVNVAPDQQDSVTVSAIGRGQEPFVFAVEDELPQSPGPGVVIEAGVAVETQSATVVFSSALVVELEGILDTSTGDIEVNEHSDTVEEAVSADDFPSAEVVYPVAVSESGAAADTQEAVAAFAVSVAESVSAADTSNATLGGEDLVLESGNALDAQSANVSYVASLTETGSITEVSDGEIGAETFNVSVEDAVNAVDSGSSTVSYAASSIESGSAVDATAAVASVMTVSVSDTVFSIDSSNGVSGLLDDVAEVLNAVDTSNASIRDNRGRITIRHRPAVSNAMRHRKVTKIDMKNS